MKYIIKNCPACTISPTCCSKWHIENGNAKDCSDIPDCLLKRIVELCKEQACLGIDCAWCADKCNLELVKFANKILELLGIEECE